MDCAELAQAVPDQRLVDGCVVAEVEAWPTELNPQSAGKSRFGIARVGAGMASVVSHDNPQRGARSLSQKHGRQRHEGGGNPGGQIVGRVVDACRCPTELSVSLVLITKGRIERVDRFEHNRSHRAKYGREKQRSRYAVD